MYSIINKLKAECNYTTHYHKKTCPKEKKAEYQHPNTNIKRSNWITNLNWRDTNTELLLKTERSNNDT